ncbi:MAG: RdgB/HAM1 family non-canonical purine NTP pyrophosphatase [Burkholderiaceae bacterium]
MSRLVIASNNPGKLREFAALLAPLAFESVAQAALGIAEVDEPHATFVENALAKARHASAASGLAALADDSGLCVDALDGLPGVRSARYADVDPADASRSTQDRRNNARLITTLAGETRRDAHYVCVLVFMRRPHDPEPIVATGRWNGRIVDVPRGDGGFGYDAHLLLPELGVTAAELDLPTKNRVSHRAIALRRLVDALREGAGR